MTVGTKLLFLHGAPAAGKLTIAQALLRLCPGRLFDNHAALDFAKTIFDFGAPGFWPLVHNVRLQAIEQAARHRIPLLVYTSCYSDPEDRPFVEAVEGILGQYQGELLPVYLQCPKALLQQRVGNADRIERQKVTSVEGLEQCLTQWNLVPLPRSNCLIVDSGKLGPEGAARQICDHFDLGA
jgi:hypothetical protein